MILPCKVLITPAAGPGKMKFEVITLRVEHIDGFAAITLHTAVILAQIIRGLECLLVIFPGHVKGLVRNAILIQGIPTDRFGTLEEDDVVVATTKAIKFLYHAGTRQC